MGKKEDLEVLDKLVREKMISCLKGGETDLLTELTSVVSYLSKNNVMSEKPKSTIEDDIQKRLQDAKDRRNGVEPEEDEEGYEF